MDFRSCVSVTVRHALRGPRHQHTRARVNMVAVSLLVALPPAWLGLVLSFAAPPHRAASRQLPSARHPHALLVAADAAPLPPSFLSGANFSRACAAHRSIARLRESAPGTFSAPQPADIFADAIVLTGDLGLELVRGREAYLAAFAGVARINGSPLLPLEAGELEISHLTPHTNAVQVDWRVPVRIGASLLPAASNVDLSGTSFYALDDQGKLSSHRLSDLRLDNRRLPSSIIGEFLALAQRRGAPSGSPVELVSLLAQALQQPVADVDREATPAAVDGANAADAADSGHGTSSWPPSPGSIVEWPRYAALHSVSTTMARQFGTLLDSPPDLGGSPSIYSEDMTLRSAAGGERLLAGRPQYSQLLSSLHRVHRAITASPLLSYSLSYRLAFNGEAAPWTTLGDAPDAAPPSTPTSQPPVDAGSKPVITVSWSYAIFAAAAPGGAPTKVFALAAESDFKLDESSEVGAAAGEAATPPAWTGGVDGSSSVRFVVRTHTLRDLTLNGRPALPAALLAQLSRAEASAPDLLSFFSSAFLSLSEGLLAPVPLKPTAGAAQPGALAASLDPAFALGFTALLRSLHGQLPVLLTEPPDLTICTPNVQLRGLLRERLAEGRPPVAAFFAAARRLYAALLSEGAISPLTPRPTQPAAGGSRPLEYKLIVAPEGDVIIEWALESTLGRSWENALGGLGGLGGQPMPPLRVGLPVRIRGEIRLRPDTRTAAVKELWIKSLFINERPLLPKLLQSWVQQGSRPSVGSSDVARDVRTIVSALLPWLSPPPQK